MKNRIFGRVSKALSGLALLVGTALAPMKEARAETNAVVNMTNNLELTWNWATQHTFNASSAGNGSIVGTNDWYDAGTPVSATAVPNQFYHFTGWSGDTNSSQNPINVAIDKPYSIVANFAKNTTVNGIDHEWLYSHNIATNDASETLHSDADGFNNYQEWIADTDPTNSLSYFPPAGIAQGSSVDISINPTSTGRYYSVHSKTNMLDSAWDFEAGTNGNGGEVIFSLNDNFNQKFYQTRVTKPE